jgi:RimJ/RimL family protein N-acetyltransferase
VPAVARACQDPQIPRWTMVPTPYLEADARTWLTQVTDPAIEDHLALAMVTSKDEFVGSMSLFMVKPGVAEFGYWTAPEMRGRGYTPRALTLLARWAFDELRLPRLQLGTLPGNTASERVAEKAGFSREGILRSYLDQRGERRDVLMWSLLPGELD